MNWYWPAISAGRRGQWYHPARIRAGSPQARCAGRRRDEYDWLPDASRGVRLLDQGTPPERMADEAIPKLMAAVPEPMRPAVVDLLHLGYGALGGAVYAAGPQAWRRHWASGPAYGMALWLGYNVGIVPLLRLHPDRPRRPHEVAMQAADHLLYGLVIGRLGRPI
jgi:hypothetical protein